MSEKHLIKASILARILATTYFFSLFPYQTNRLLSLCSKNSFRSLCTAQPKTLPSDKNLTLLHISEYFFVLSIDSKHSFFARKEGGIGHINKINPCKNALIRFSPYYVYEILFQMVCIPITRKWLYICDWFLSGNSLLKYVSTVVQYLFSPNFFYCKQFSRKAQFLF